MYTSKKEVLNLLKKQPDNFRDILNEMSEELYSDKEIVIRALELDFEIYGLNSNPDFMLRVPIEMRDNKDFIMEAISHNAFALEYATNRLKDDEDIAILAVKNEVFSLQYISDRLKKDKKFAKKALIIDDLSLKYIDKELKKDKKFLIEALSDTSGIADGSVFYHLGGEFYDDKDLVLVVVKRHGGEIMEVSERLRDDKEIAIAAIKNNFPLAFEYLSNRLRDDKELLVFALNDKGLGSEDANEILSYASERLQNDKDILEIMKKFK